MITDVEGLKDEKVKNMQVKKEENNNNKEEHMSSLNNSTSLQVKSMHYEEGDKIEEKYVLKSWISIETLLHDMIVKSNNTAAHMLYENLGGWMKFKEACAKFSKTEVEDSFYTYNNVLTARYMNDVLSYVYEHQDIFSILLKDMYASMPDTYLNQNMPSVTAQKYGFYQSAANASGLVLEGHPYSIVVFTSLGTKGISYIGEINQLCYNYFNS